MIVFSQDWFIKNQTKLLSLARSPIGKWAFGLDVSYDRPIDFVLPNSLGWVNADKSITQQFHSGIPHAKTLYKNLYPMWRTMHEFDRLFAQPLLPALDFGFTTLTANPVAGAVSPCDGPVNEVGQNSTFATIIAAAGNQGGLEAVGSDNPAGVTSSTTTNQFAAIHRGGFNFDTSGIGAGQTISAAVFSVVANFKRNNLGSDTYDCVQFSPVSTASIPNTAFTLFGSTSFANVLYANVDSTGSVYTDWTLSAGGISNISTSGVSSFGLRSGWDRSGSFGGVWASAVDTNIQIAWADSGSNKPKLVVTYAASGGGGSVSLPWRMLMGMGR